MEKTTTHIIKISTETMLQSWISDLSSFVLAVSLIGIGVYLKSDAMQWLGFVMFFLVSLVKGSGKIKKFTPEQAIEYIKELK